MMQIPVIKQLILS